MLHRREGPYAGEGRADYDFHRDLLVGRPLAVDFLVARDVLEYLGAGRTGVRGRDDDAGFVRAPGDSFVPRKNYFHRISPLPPI